MQETQQARQQAPALERHQNAQPNHHHHFTMIPEAGLLLGAIRTRLLVQMHE
jgi:hypothetical protein